MIVHGACSQPAHMQPWHAYFAARGYRCLVPALPGHAPSDPAVLTGLGIEDCLAAIAEVRAGLDQPPVVIGHSMGGLLAQMLAARTTCAGIVLVASVPSGFLPGTLRGMPFGLLVAPQVLAGRPFRPPRQGLRALTLHHLPEDERETLLADFVAESGRVYRQMIFGKARVRRREVRCPVLVIGGGADRLVPAAVARMLATRYTADLIIVPDQGHWLVAPSLVDSVAGVVLPWIEGLGAGGGRPSLGPGQGL